MTLADVNVLVYALRKDSAHHAVCKAWLDRIVTGEARFAVSPLVLCGVVRTTTNPRIFRQPSTLDEALGFCDDLLDQPHCEIVKPGERHWAIFKRICLVSDIRGPRVSDAWFAALAIEHACTWISYDGDFVRFSGLHWEEPTP